MDKELFKAAPFHCATSIRYYLFGTHALIKSCLKIVFSRACHQHLWRTHVPNNKRMLSSHFIYREQRHNEFSASLRQLWPYFYFIHTLKPQLLLISAAAVTKSCAKVLQNQSQLFQTRPPRERGKHSDYRGKTVQTIWVLPERKVRAQVRNQLLHIASCSSAQQISHFLLHLLPNEWNQLQNTNWALQEPDLSIPKH